MHADSTNSIIQSTAQSLFMLCSQHQQCNSTEKPYNYFLKIHKCSIYSTSKSCFMLCSQHHQCNCRWQHKILNCVISPENLSVQACYCLRNYLHPAYLLTNKLKLKSTCTNNKLLFLYFCCTFLYFNFVKQHT